MEKNKNSLDEKVEIYEKKFSGLTDDEIRILAYREIYETKMSEKTLLDEEKKEMTIWKLF